MNRRHEYSLDLSDFEHCYPSTPAAHLQLRMALSTDAIALVELMIEAYRGTIDYDDETLEDAVAEVHTYLAGERGAQPLLTHSCLAFDGPRLVGSCLTGEWNERRLPLIAYVMTHARYKNRGVGKQVLWVVLQSLYEQGYHEVRAVITEGNTPSEQLFGRPGFRKVDAT